MDNINIKMCELALRVILLLYLLALDSTMHARAVHSLLHTSKVQSTH
jgi:hypothetical protein